MYGHTLDLKCISRSQKTFFFFLGFEKHGKGFVSLSVSFYIQHSVKENSPTYCPTDNCITREEMRQNMQQGYRQKNKNSHTAVRIQQGF